MAAVTNLRAKGALATFLNNQDTDFSALETFIDQTGRWIYQTVSYDDFTDGGSTTGTFTLTEGTIPVGAYVDFAIVKDVTGFAGDTSATLQIGDGSDVDRYSTGTPSVFSTADAINVGVPSGIKHHTAAKSVVLTVTSGADFTSVSAGQLTVAVHYFVV